MTATNYVREYSLELHEKPDNSQIGKVLRGSIDMHIHLAPAIMPHRQNALETALTAREIGLRGIVLKSHTYPTAPLASLVSDLVPEIAVFGSLCLENECGGLNVHAVETAAKLGAKVVWMPVLCSTNSKSLVARKLGLDIGGDGISILGADGKLVPEIEDILKVIKDYDLVLATGHISSREILALADKAKQLGIVKMVVTHAMSNFISESILSHSERVMLAHEGVLIEHTFCEISPTSGCVNPADIAAAIKSEGPSNCIMSTDTGRMPHPTVAEGMRTFISAMLKCGLSEEEITCMVKLNPARLLGL